MTIDSLDDAFQAAAIESVSESEGTINSDRLIDWLLRNNDRENRFSKEHEERWLLATWLDPIRGDERTDLLAIGRLTRHWHVLIPRKTPSRLY